MIVRKPMILYYDNGQKEKSKSMKRALEHMGITFVPITGAHFLQTVGHLAKVKGFPARKHQRCSHNVQLYRRKTRYVSEFHESRCRSPGSPEGCSDSSKLFLDFCSVVSGTGRRTSQFLL